MSARYLSDSLGEGHVRFHWSRWSGGADAGRTHVWASGPGAHFTARSTQCVVDDFGTLVPAEQA